MTAKIAINRPELHNAFRPITVNEMRKALELAQDDRCVCLCVLILLYCCILFYICVLSIP